MLFSFRSKFASLRWLGLTVVAVAVLASCGPTANQPAGPTTGFGGAKEAFKNGQLDKALDLTEDLANATPPGEFTARAQVLRAVIYAGKFKSAMELAGAYGQGVDKTKNPNFKSAYRRLQNDNLTVAAGAALHFAETAHQLAPDGAIAKELTLEASFPSTEGPTQVQGLTRVEEGGWLEPDLQDVAATDARRKGIDDALAEVVSGDRAKARQALAAGSTKISGASFAIFLGKELADGAVVFDRHHKRDMQRMKTLCDEGDEVLKAAKAQLKEVPDKEQEKTIKKLEDKFKALLKSM